MPVRRESLASRVHRFWIDCRAIVAVAALIACGGATDSVAPGGGGGGGVQIVITPNAPSITVGAQATLQAEVRGANGQVISGATVFWSSADTNVVTVSSAGVITGKSVGNTQIAASSSGASAVATVTVQQIPVASVAVLPSAATLVIGGSVTLQTVAYDANANPLTGRSIVWASSASQVATVDASGKVTAIAAGTATVSGTVEGKTASSAITVTVIPVAAVAVIPGSAALDVGASKAFTAVATDANGNTLAGRPVTWASANTSIATVSTAGLVTGTGAGTTNITATAEGRTGTAQVVVTATTPPPPIPVASVVVNPGTASLNIGGSVTLSATLRDANGATLSGRAITWSSSATAIATVSSTGVVNAIAPGSATITATSEGKSGSATITVLPQAPPSVASVTIVPNGATIDSGQTVTLTATVRDSAGNALSGRAVSWSNNGSSVATVSQSGVVTSVALGSAPITAKSDTASASVIVTVRRVPVASVIVVPSSATIQVAATVTLTDTTKDASGNVLANRPVTWSSSAPTIASVDANGTVTGRAAGSATITGTSEGKSGSATITVPPLPPSVGSVTIVPNGATIDSGKTVTLTATVRDSAGNALSGRAVSWSNNGSSVATVSQSGVVTGVALGSAPITARSDTASASVIVTVLRVPVASVTVSAANSTIQVGATTTVTAVMKDAGNHVLAGRTVRWKSNNIGVATVDSVSGVVTAVAPGTVSIIGTSEGQTGSTSITVIPIPVATVTISPSNPSVVERLTTRLAAITKDANGNTLTGRAVTWSIGSTSVATITAAINADTGVVTGVSFGTTTVTATSETKVGTATLTVTQAPVATVTVASPGGPLTVGQTLTLAATTKDAGGFVLTGRTITWASNNSSKATVDPNTGLITAVDSGSATITATSEGQSGSTTVTVQLVPVASVIVAVTTPLAMGQTATATATPQDAGGHALTGRLVTWASTDQTIVTVDSAGVVTPVAPGTATITATVDGTTGSIPITITP